MNNNNKNNIAPLYKKSILTTKEAAKLLKVGVQTIKNYIYSGKIKSFKTPGGHHRILRSDLPHQLETTFLEELKNSTEEYMKVNGNSKVTDTHETYLVIIKALSKAMAMREAPEVGHADFAVAYSLKMAEELKLSNEEKKTLELASLLRDLGKVGVSEQILGKPGKLTEQEYMVVKEHPKIAERIVRDIKFLENTKPLIRHHHESFNGTGYPDGLAGENIPLGARILAIAGVFQALVSDRPYRKAYSKEDAINIIKEHSGTQFDPTLVGHFLKIA
ncbi:MAG: HD domain-containing phosphohydrolase [Candidatus Gorgyraea atricola]|nr:HD domain-containing phosphohydrolase [Candidatus Gorgyraea atricola]